MADEQKLKIPELADSSPVEPLKKLKSSSSPKTNEIPFPPMGRKGGRRHYRDGVFNASAHEVPSGPNPISNR